MFRRRNLQRVSIIYRGRNETGGRNRKNKKSSACTGGALYRPLIKVSLRVSRLTGKYVVCCLRNIHTRQRARRPAAVLLDYSTGKEKKERKNDGNQPVRLGRHKRKNLSVSFAFPDILPTRQTFDGFARPFALRLMLQTKNLKKELRDNRLC